MVPPSKSQMGYENPSEGAVRIAAGHLATTIRASDSEVKQVILLPGSVLHVPRAFVDRGGRSPCENSLVVPLLAGYENVATLFCVSACCITFDCIYEGRRTPYAVDGVVK